MATLTRRQWSKTLDQTLDAYALLCEAERGLQVGIDDAVMALQYIRASKDALRPANTQIEMNLIAARSA